MDPQELFRDDPDLFKPNFNKDRALKEMRFMSDELCKDPLRVFKVNQVHDFMGTFPNQDYREIGFHGVPYYINGNICAKNLRSYAFHLADLIECEHNSINDPALNLILSPKEQDVVYNIEKNFDCFRNIRRIGSFADFLSSKKNVQFGIEQARLTLFHDVGAITEEAYQLGLENLQKELDRYGFNGFHRMIACNKPLEDLLCSKHKHFLELRSKFNNGEIKELNWEEAVKEQSAFRGLYDAFKKNFYCSTDEVLDFSWGYSDHYKEYDIKEILNTPCDEIIKRLESDNPNEKLGMQKLISGKYRNVLFDPEFNFDIDAMQHLPPEQLAPLKKIKQMRDAMKEFVEDYREVSYGEDPEKYSFARSEAAFAEVKKELQDFALISPTALPDYTVAIKEPLLSLPPANSPKMPNFAEVENQRSAKRKDIEYYNKKPADISSPEDILRADSGKQEIIIPETVTKPSPIAKEESLISKANKLSLGKANVAILVGVGVISVGLLGYFTHKYNEEKNAKNKANFKA